MIFNSSAYLTIDDSPSERMDDLTGWLQEKGIPAIFFCRGDKLEENPMAAVRAVQKGFVLANHATTHQRSSQKDAGWVIDEIKQCEFLLERIYKEAGVIKTHKFFRFPQLDRGTAGWIVDYDDYSAEDRAALLAAFAEGLNVQSMDKPGPELWEKKAQIQKYLKDSGYVQPFKGVTHDWYKDGEIADAADCLYTYSNCDWMVTARHAGKWPYKNAEDLKNKARTDKWLTADGGVNVVLAHDQAEIVDITIELLEDMASNGLKFLEV